MSDLLRRTLGETDRRWRPCWPAACGRPSPTPTSSRTPLVNLAVNARDAMPDGGTLTIETANAYLDEAYAAQLRRRVAPASTCCSASPTPAAASHPTCCDRVFEPFFTTKERRQGHRPRPRHGVRLRQAVGRPHPHLQRGRPRHDGEDLSAALPSKRGGLGAGARPGAAAADGDARARGRRDDPAGRGQRGRARLRQVDARGAGLPRARCGATPSRRCSVLECAPRASTCCSPTSCCRAA